MLVINQNPSHLDTGFWNALTPQQLPVLSEDKQGTEGQILEPSVHQRDGGDWSSPALLGICGVEQGIEASTGPAVTGLTPGVACVELVNDQSVVSAYPT